MSQCNIIEVIGIVNEGQVLTVDCEGGDTFSSRVMRKERNRVTLFNGMVVYLSTSGWICPSGDTAKRVISVKIDKACKDCPLSSVET